MTSVDGRGASRVCSRAKYGENWEEDMLSGSRSSDSGQRSGLREHWEAVKNEVRSDRTAIYHLLIRSHLCNEDKPKVPVFSELCSSFISAGTLLNVPCMIILERGTLPYPKDLSFISSRGQLEQVEGH